MLTTAKEYLRQYGDLDRSLRNIKKELERAELEADAIRSTSDNDGQPHGSNIGHPTEEKAIRIADYKKDLKALESQADAKRREIVFNILKVDGPEQDVLMLRYIELMRWEDITYEIGYSWKHTHRLHGSGLKKIEKILTMS